MAKAYGIDLRQKVFDLLKNGKSKEFISRLLIIATKTNVAQEV